MVLPNKAEIYYSVTVQAGVLKLNSRREDERLSEDDLWDMNWRDAPLGL
jgi:hypothetical protein